jgi:hypothetical protein
LQGATSGTIGPQGSDATVITGVNTAGTVRVDNDAPLETALKLLFSALQGGGIISGAIFLFQGFFMQNTRLGASKKLVIGSFLLLLGIAASNLYPMLFVRDVDMFS